MESISIDSLDSGGVKRNYVELSSFVFEGLSLEPNLHFIDVKIMSGAQENVQGQSSKRVFV